MNDSLIILLSDIFTKKMDNGEDGFMVIKFSVPLKSLYNLYERLSKVDVPPIETLPEEQRLKYWNISKNYFTEQEQAVKGAKAAYLLELITNY